MSSGNNESVHMRSRKFRSGGRDGDLDLSGSGRGTLSGLPPESLATGEIPPQTHGASDRVRDTIQYMFDRIGSHCTNYLLVNLQFSFRGT